MLKRFKPFLGKKNITSGGAFLGAAPGVCYHITSAEYRRENIYTASQRKLSANRQILSQEHVYLILNITSCRFTL